MYIFGGVNTEGAEFSDVWQYSTITSLWTQVSTQRSMIARNGHTAVNINGNIFVFGGTFDNGAVVLGDLIELFISESKASISYQGPIKAGKLHVDMVNGIFLFSQFTIKTTDV